MSHSLDKQISVTEIKLKKWKAERREDLKAERRRRPRKKRGRKPIDEDILALAEKLAMRKPLSEVALQLNVSLRSLYNKGISRAALNEKNS